MKQRVPFPISRAGPRSPVDVALDGAGLGSRVDRALDTGHGGVPRLIYISGLELDLDYLPALERQTSSGKARCRLPEKEGGDARRSQCVNQ